MENTCGHLGLIFTGTTGNKGSPEVSMRVCYESSNVDTLSTSLVFPDVPVSPFFRPGGPG